MTKYRYDTITMSGLSPSIFTLPPSVVESEEFNRYVGECMLEDNKVNPWMIDYKKMKIPVVAVMKDSEFMSRTRKEARKAGREQFRCSQCASNCDKLVTIIGKTQYILCSHTKNITSYASNIRSVADKVYRYAKKNLGSYSLQIATDKLLLKDKYNYVNPNNPPADTSQTFLHYAGNCDTIEAQLFEKSRETTPSSKKHNDKVDNLNILNRALDQYFIPMQKLLFKITSDWNNAGRRHATLQRIRTIQELSVEVTYAEVHFEKTLRWILKVLGGFTKPFDTKYYAMTDIVENVAKAIADGRLAYSDPLEKSVIHYQYSQMNNTIMMWMEKAVSRTALKKMMTDLCGPNKGQRTKEITVQQIETVEKSIGTNFWTRVATTKTLQDFYGDGEDSDFFWLSPHIRESNMSGASSGFAAIKANAKNHKQASPGVCDWKTPCKNPESIPELIKLLLTGETIYIDCASNEHAVLAHTSIDPKYMACCPVEGKGALMWSFLGGKGYGIHLSGNTKWRKLVAIHRLTTGPFSNYILVCETSRELVQYLTKNPVMGDWTLRANSKRIMGPVFSKLKNTTQLSKNTIAGYTAFKEYPIIGVGVCKGTSEKLAYDHVISYKIGTAFTKEVHMIRYYERLPVTAKYSHSNTVANFCSNCGAPRSSKTANFCSNCGRSF